MSEEGVDAEHLVKPIEGDTWIIPGADVFMYKDGTKVKELKNVLELLNASMLTKATTIATNLGRKRGLLTSDFGVFADAESRDSQGVGVRDARPDLSRSTERRHRDERHADPLCRARLFDLTATRPVRPLRIRDALHRDDGRRVRASLC